MNERIGELSKQAREYVQQYVNESVIDYGKTASEFHLIFQSKFSELIIQDCVAQIALLGISNFENKDIMWAVENSIENIKERFGITQ